MAVTTNMPASIYDPNHYFNRAYLGNIPLQPLKTGRYRCESSYDPIRGYYIRDMYEEYSDGSWRVTSSMPVTEEYSHTYEYPGSTQTSKATKQAEVARSKKDTAILRLFHRNRKGL